MALLEKETEEREEREKETEKEREKQTEKQREKDKEEERVKEREEEEEREKGDEECRCKSYLCWPFLRVRCRKRRAHNSSPSNPTSGAPLKEPSSCKEESCKVVPAEQAVEVGGTGIHSIPKAEQDLILSSRLRRFSFGELKAATRNFRPDSLLGEGGFGCVFKGWVDEHGTAAVKPGTGLTVAVKTLNHNGLQGHREWLTEVNFLGQLHHPNLVKLIGCCIEDDHRLLVYEFMQRGSLENHLFRRGALPLPWNTRMKIALGAAKGLEFLHSGEKPVIYRDFKTSNILLDSEYNAKLSDFGLAKDGPERDKSHVSTRVMGTYGYAAPEYIMTGHLSVKSDVYSFGVVLLEILTGRKCMDKSRPSREHNLVEWARPYLGDKRKLFKLVDPRLEGQFSIKAAQKAAGLGHRCIGRDSKSRPLMSEVVDILISIQGLTDMANISTHFPPLATDRYLRASMNPYNKLHLGPRNNNYNMAYQYHKPNHP